MFIDVGHAVSMAAHASNDWLDIRRHTKIHVVF
jgi:hypothetical protein